MLKINDASINDLGMIVTPGYSDPHSPTFENIVLKIPNRPGVLKVKQEINSKSLSIPITYVPDDTMDVQDRLDTLNDLFYDENGYTKPVKIELMQWRGKHTIMELTEPLNSDRNHAATSFVLNLSTYDEPYKTSNVYADEIVWGSEEITFESDYSLGHTGSPSKITVVGNTELDLFVSGLNVFPSIYITGSATNLKLTTNGQSIELGTFSNANWEIEQFYAWKNGEEAFVDARKFKLLKGNNKLVVSGTNIDIEISIKYRDKYN